MQEVAMDGEVRGNASRPWDAGVDFLITSALVGSCALIAWITIAH
jgi:hypothetical protein